MVTLPAGPWATAPGDLPGTPALRVVTFRDATDQARRGKDITLRRNLRLLREAVAMEEGIPYIEPPFWYAPVERTLGADVARRLRDTSLAIYERGRDIAAACGRLAKFGIDARHLRTFRNSAGGEFRMAWTISSAVTVARPKAALTKSRSTAQTRSYRDSAAAGSPYRSTPPTRVPTCATSCTTAARRC